MTKTGYPRTVLKYTNVFNPQLHPTQKNVELNEFLINLFTDENDFVIDNTMGSCSTGIACLNTKRRFLGIEMNEDYFNIASKRVEEKRKEKEIEAPTLFNELN
jgi:site-specific DNA-methyltransferase (adenine-specific)